METHKQKGNIMRAYPELKGSDRVKETCNRCGGYGRIEAFSHTMDGICFECNGHGGKSVLVSSVRAREARRAKQQQQYQELQQRVDQIWQALREEHNEAWHVLKDNPDNEFVSSVVGRIERGIVPSDKQLQALINFSAPKPQIVPVPEGRYQVTGQVISTKWQEGYYGSTLKMLVEDDQGYRVWGTVPRALDVVQGDRIRFTATLAQSETDKGFGFFKRPTKAERV